MAHDHSADSDEAHHHSHVPVITSLNKAFTIGIVLNFGYVIVQVVIGLRIKSFSI